MPYEPSDEEKRLAELAQQYRDRLIEQAKELEQKYKDPATSDRHKEHINSYLNLREQHAEHFRELVATNDPEIRKPLIDYWRLQSPLGAKSSVVAIGLFPRVSCPETSLRRALLQHVL
jgi:hypothetical protein